MSYLSFLYGASFASAGMLLFSIPAMFFDYRRHRREVGEEFDQILGHDTKVCSDDAYEALELPRATTATLNYN